MVKNKDLSMRRDTFDVHALNVAHLTQLHSSLVVVCVVVVVVVARRFLSPQKIAQTSVLIPSKDSLLGKSMMTHLLSLC